MQQYPPNNQQQPYYAHPGYYQPPPQPPKRYNRTSITLTTLFVLALLLMGSVVAYLNRAGATQSGVWTTTHTFTGSGITKTALFTVATDWKLLYSCDNTMSDSEAYIGVTVYDSNASLVDVAVNTTCAAGQVTNGSTYEYNGGNIYLSINGTGQWNLTVQEPK